ncbi:MAG: DUF547 domain-containing protein [Hyphomicrobiaceae bacterium]|jgi:hypothetical protein
MRKFQFMTACHVALRFVRRAAALGLVLSVLSSAAAIAAEPAELLGRGTPKSRFTVDHQAWDVLLKRFVTPSQDGINRVDYAAFKAGGHKELKLYIRTLESIDPATLDRKEQFAFLANLYNAKTIDIVLDHYPVASIKDISLGGGLFAALTGGPWKAKVLTLGGVSLSLDDIEHGMLRPVFKDPRVHYAVNCASIGCPNLQDAAFTGAALDAQLDAAARDYVNNARGASIANGMLIVSSIYSWFKADFGNSDEGVIRHLRTYAAPSKAAELKAISSISSHAYDWRLNDTKH